MRSSEIVRIAAARLMSGQLCWWREKELCGEQQWPAKARRVLLPVDEACCGGDEDRMGLDWQLVQTYFYDIIILNIIMFFFYFFFFGGSKIFDSPMVR